MPIVTLNQAFVAKLSCPDGKARIEWCCNELPGFYVETRITSPGEGTYYLRYKDARSKTCHARIGRTTDITLAEARKHAKKVKAEVALGADPSGEAKAAKAVPTLADFFNDHYLAHVKAYKRSWKRDEELFRLRIEPEFGHLRLNQIMRKHVQSFHAALPSKGLSPATADHHVKLMRFMLNMAVEWEMLGRNALQGIKQFAVDNQVENCLDDKQMVSLLEVLRTDENRPVAMIASFLLSTGARLNEALQATWDQVNEETRMWRIPAQNSKSKRMRSVPLNDSALHVLKQLTTRGTFDHLFINPQTGKPYTTIMKVWARLRDKAGLPHLRIHDLRHNYASLLVNDGRTLYDVQQILGHSDPKVTMRYAHLSARRLQEAANSASVIVRAGVEQ